MFDALPTPVSFPKLEEQVLEFWRERKIYEESLARRKGAPKFVFYEGPPTANGKPHPGHCLTRAIKDIFPRYRTMRGFFCERKAGWDTHGLPVEVEVCKELGIHAKEEIEAFGIEPFIHKCQESVWRYMQEWERMTERLGFWVNLKDAYVTYHQSYIESVWWSLKTLFDRGLLYQGHKIVWWWAQGGTALSAGEVGLGYREVADPSVYVKFPLLDDAGKKTDTSLLVWTTTPWTLPSNQFAAVHPDLDYVTVVDQHEGKTERLVMAAALVGTIAGKVKREFKVESTCKGSTLLGRRYLPPFDYYYSKLSTRLGVRKLDGRGDGNSTYVTNPELRREVDAAVSRLSSRGDGIGEPLEFYDFERVPIAWRVVEGGFVTVDSGTGIVHLAPAFGEVDFDVLREEQDRFIDPRPELINAVGPDGKFTADAPDYQGRWVKEADKDISRDLKSRGLLFHQEQYLHEYPFCWRAEQDPLIQYPRKSWFIRTSQFKEEMLANNAEVNWLPEHIKEGRFGNFLASNVDWALSRERYWGTPLPIWVCEQTGKMEAIGGYDELLAKKGVRGTEVWEAAKKAKPGLVEDLKVHKPYIDEITYDSPFAPGARMKRVTEVIDCWYDSGAMPFAQWGYPHEGQEKFRTQFPADFISEAIDQTRGWFYSQLAISTLLFGRSRLPGGTSAAESAIAPPPGAARQAAPTEYPHPFRTCIVLGLMLAEWWESKDGKQVFLTEEDAAAALGPNVAAHRVGKMSKSKRNYREPQEIFDRYGADALRWYFFANQAPWTSIRYSERAIRDSIPEFLLRLWNCYSFFVIYANIDGFDPGQRLLAGDVGDLKGEAFRLGKGWREVSERAELDRWILSELNRTAAAVVERMDAYDNFNAAQAINAFVDALSNWYVRRSRDRYWSAEKESPDKLDAYWTLYECLITTSKLIAPFVPFLAEALWQNLAGVFQGRALQSVHLADYPTGDASAVDENLSARMNLMREITSLGLRARMGAKLKVRQPLSKLEIILASPEHQDWLRSHDAILRDELNVKQIEYTAEADKYITYEIQPNFKLLGPRLGKLLPQAKQALGKANGAALLAEMRTKGKVTLELAGERIELDANDIQVRLKAKPGWVAEDSPHCVVVLSTELTPELIREGLARDLVRLIQDRRKDMDCQYTDRLEVGIVTDSAELQQAIRENAAYIQGETLASKLDLIPIPGVEGAATDIGGQECKLYVRVIAS